MQDSPTGFQSATFISGSCGELHFPEARVSKSEWNLLCDYICTLYGHLKLGIGILHIFQAVNGQAELAILSPRLYTLVNKQLPHSCFETVRFASALCKLRYSYLFRETGKLRVRMKICFKFNKQSVSFYSMFIR
ncbi:unnamed protein product [Trifolium pratense]|uniref:Uncharacterized protein n=1 Tax=Trifolium pratense TaxID=57577 RepID=A0ACB0JXP7_TRIPR|nr:unnamed protein product [Trifolium pratense]